MTPAEFVIGITGASGQLGMLVADVLLSGVAPARVVLISRHPARLAAFERRGAHVRFGDFDQVENLLAAFAGVSSLLLISTSALGRRVAQHAAALEAARAAGVKHVVYTSFLGADPGNPALVARDHTATEQALRASGLQWTILRHAQYAEAILDVIMPNALARSAWRSSSGDGRIAPISRADCAACAAAAAVRPDKAGRVYQVTGPDLFTYCDMAAMIAKATDRPLRFEPCDDAGLYAMFDALGVARAPFESEGSGVPWCSDDMVSFEAALREGWFDVLSLDAETLLGRRPISFAELLSDRVRAMRESAA